MRYIITVKPGTSREVVVPGSDAASLTVYLRARAHDGEANKALIKVLSKHFHVAKGKIIILRGAKSRQKIVDILS